MLQMDQQRIERLQQCRILQETLRDCRKASAGGTDGGGGERRRTIRLEDSSAGVRMLRFFKWRGEEVAELGYDATCAREEHALWACRAVALQCGGDLDALRHCFDNLQKVGTSGEPEDVGAVLSCRRTAYEVSSNKKKKSGDGNEEKSAVIDDNHNNDIDIPCREIQERMGRCIAENSKALAERHLARTQKEEKESS